MAEDEKKDGVDEVTRLFAQLQRGDLRAKDRVVEHFRPHVARSARFSHRRFIQTNGVSPGDIEQAAWLRILGALSRYEYRNQQAFEAWLHVIVRHVAIDLQKPSNGRQSRGDAAAVAEEEDLADPRSICERRELRRLVLQALTQVPEDAAKLFELVVLRDKSVRKAARLLGLTEATARRTVVRTKIHLALLLRRLR